MGTFRKILSVRDGLKKILGNSTELEKRLNKLNPVKILPPQEITTLSETVNNSSENEVFEENRAKTPIASPTKVPNKSSVVGISTRKIIITIIISWAIF